MPTNKDDAPSSIEVEPAEHGVVVPSGSDRRRFPRHAITLRVDYKRMNTFFADYAKNISKGGTFIRTSKPLDVGTEFVFVLSIPGQPDQLQLLGEVMWTVDEKRATEEQPAGMGIRFRFTDDSERTQLEQFVGKLMSDKLGGHVAAMLLGKDSKG
jgi:type IV pilus assembly protein PilZ